jgi:hypothetical protein
LVDHGAVLNVSVWRDVRMADMLNGKPRCGLVAYATSPLGRDSLRLRIEPSAMEAWLTFHHWEDLDRESLRARG